MSAKARTSESEAKDKKCPHIVTLCSKCLSTPNCWLEITDYGQSTNEGINQRNLKIWADVADKICFGST